MKNFLVDHISEVLGVVTVLMMIGDIAIFKRLDDIEHCRI